jgi:hypothetical protein
MPPSIGTVASRHLVVPGFGRPAAEAETGHGDHKTTLNSSFTLVRLLSVPSPPGDKFSGAQAA